MDFRIPCLGIVLDEFMFPQFHTPSLSLMILITVFNNFVYFILSQTI